MLTGAIAAAARRRRGGDDLDEDAIGPLTALPGRTRHRRRPGLRYDRRGDPALGARTPARGRTVVQARPEGFHGDPRRGTVDIGHGSATHAKEAGADAVAVIAPPYFPLDERACSNTCVRPPRRAVRCRSTSTSSPDGRATRSRSRDRTPPGDLAESRGHEGVRHALERGRTLRARGLDLFVGSEPLVLERWSTAPTARSPASRRRSPGSWPRSCTSGTRRRANGPRRCGRSSADPFHAALKEILVARGVPIRPAVRSPLRPLAPEEREIAFDAARRVGAL